MISVIICTHNPREDYLQRTLEGLRKQTMPFAQWEMLLIDNASKEPLAKTWDLNWHPQGRIILEAELGLTPTRLRGIRESKGELLVFVDDDNILAPDYLEQARNLFTRRTDLGVASGRLLPEYETPPPAWFGPYESWIAVRRIERSTWANFLDHRAEPCGAGMTMRQDVALAYLRKATENTGQKALGRKGNSLISGEDVVIAKSAINLGYSMGQFTELHLLHLIPSRRVDEKYLFSLYCHLHASGQLIGWLDQSGHQPLPRPSWRVYAKSALRFVRGGKIERRLVKEEFRAYKLAQKVAAEVNASSVASQS